MQLKADSKCGFELQSLDLSLLLAICTPAGQASSLWDTSEAGELENTYPPLFISPTEVMHPGGYTGTGMDEEGNTARTFPFEGRKKWGIIVFQGLWFYVFQIINDNNTQDDNGKLSKREKRFLTCEILCPQHKVMAKPENHLVS